MSEHTHPVHEEGGEECFEHNPHWHDDFQYVYEAQGGEVPEKPPTVEAIAEVIKESFGDTKVFRYAFVVVDETGQIHVGAPADGPYQTLNLLTRAASILSYQQAVIEQHVGNPLSEILGSIDPQDMREAIKRLAGDENAPTPEKVYSDNARQEVKDAHQSAFGNPDGYL
jgi:hypothetical protein